MAGDYTGVNFKAMVEAGEEEVPPEVRLQDLLANADLVEERALRKAVIVPAAFLDGQADQVVRDNRIGVSVATYGVWRPLQRSIGSPFE